MDVGKLACYLDGKGLEALGGLNSCAFKTIAVGKDSTPKIAILA